MMRFRRATNRHDVWGEFREANWEEIGRTGLPASIFRTEQRLVEFLSEGEIEDETVDLRTIPDEQFLRLEKIVNAYFFDGWEQASWAVLRAERLRRFGRYA